MSGPGNVPVEGMAVVPAAAAAAGGPPDPRVVNLLMQGVALPAAAAGTPGNGHPHLPMQGVALPAAAADHPGNGQPPGWWTFNEDGEFEFIGDLPTRNTQRAVEISRVPLGRFDLTVDVGANTRRGDIFIHVGGGNNVEIQVLPEVVTGTADMGFNPSGRYTMFGELENGRLEIQFWQNPEVEFRW